METLVISSDSSPQRSFNKKKKENNRTECSMFNSQRQLLSSGQLMVTNTCSGKDKRNEQVPLNVVMVGCTRTCAKRNVNARGRALMFAT